jgi:two-component system sensor histidine kinase DesK
MRVVFVIAGGAGILLDGPVSWVQEAAVAAIAVLLIVVPVRWYRQSLSTVMLEVLLSIALALLVPGMGIFPLFVISGDLGCMVVPPGIPRLVAALLGSAAAWSLTGWQHPFPYTEFFVLAAIFSIAMWSNSVSARDQIALNRAYDDLRKAQATIRELGGLQERERIAQDLHDVLGHSLTLIVLKAQLMQERIKREQYSELSQDTAELLAAARRSLEDVRSVVQDLPSSKSPSIEALTRALKDANIEVQVHWQPDPAYTAELVQDILSIAQEAVTNVLRHAAAKTVTIRLTSQDQRWTLLVSDDGRGASEAQEGRGLSGIRRRAEHWGGAVQVGVRPQGGTELKVTGTEAAHE